MDIGAQLRTARETRGLSIDALAHTLRVKARILSAIEHNDLSTVPPRPFGRGVVRAYAHEVGLDPDGTAREYFARFAPVAPAPSAEPAPVPSIRRVPILAGRLVPVLAGGLAIAAIALMAWAGSHGRTVVPAETAVPVGTAGSTESSAADSAKPLAIPTSGSSTARVNPAAPGMTVVLSATRVCWVSVTADGRRVLYRLLQPGSRETFSASQSVVVRTGDAGALLWSVGDRAPQPAGRSGEVKTFTIAAETR